MQSRHRCHRAASCLGALLAVVVVAVVVSAASARRLTSAYASDDDGADVTSTSCTYGGSVARSGRWLTGPALTCYCSNGEWEQCHPNPSPPAGSDPQPVWPSPSCPSGYDAFSPDDGVCKKISKAGPGPGGECPKGYSWQGSECYELEHETEVEWVCEGGWSLAWVESYKAYMCTDPDW